MLVHVLPPSVLNAKLLMALPLSEKCLVLRAPAISYCNIRIVGSRENFYSSKSIRTTTPYKVTYANIIFTTCACIAERRVRTVSTPIRNLPGAAHPKGKFSASSKILINNSALCMIQCVRIWHNINFVHACNTRQRKQHYYPEVFNFFHGANVLATNHRNVNLVL